MEKYEKINDLIDKQAKALVGKLCKRIEVLEKENSFTPKLYKALIKEIIYENARETKKLAELYIRIGKVIFNKQSK